MSRIPCHTDLHPGRNVYLTSWFILSVLFLTGCKTSVVPTHVQDVDHTDLHLGSIIYLTSWFILSVLFLTFSETSVVPAHVQNPQSHGLHPNRSIYLTSWFILSVVFDRQLDICGPFTCLGSPVTWISTLVGTST